MLFDFFTDLRGNAVKTGPRKKTIFLLILLALICICTVELIVCRSYDPALYHSITDPVVTAVTDTVTAVSSAAHNAANAVREKINAMIQKAEERATEELAQTQPESPKHPDENVLTPVLAEDQTATLPLFKTSAVICDPSVTQLLTTGSNDILTGGIFDLVYYNQGAPDWCDLKYGSDKIGSHGCGPVAMSMVVSSLTDTVTDPYAMAQWAVSNGYYARHSGSYHSIVIGTAAGFGLQAESFSSRDIVDLQDAILSGKLLVALMGPGHFTQSGHFIVLRGVTLSGEILVADPSSLDRSLTAWDAQVIFDELSRSTSDGGPLWVISASDFSALE